VGNHEPAVAAFSANAGGGSAEQASLAGSVRHYAPGVQSQSPGRIECAACLRQASLSSASP
jgi:hypothetical protein